MDNAVEFIKDNIDPLQILNYYDFQKVTEHDAEIRACCAIHGGDNPLGFVWNKKNNLWYCYTGDCEGGDVFDLIQKIDGVGFKEAVNKAASILHLNVEGMTVKRSDTLSEQKKWLNKQNHKSNPHRHYEMPAFKPIENEETINDTFTGLNKHFTIDTLKFFKSSLTSLFPTEKMLLKNKIVIPLTMESELKGVALRDSTGLYQPKWLYQPQGIKTNDILYNWDRAVEVIDRMSIQEVILVEGIFDVWAYHEIGVDNVIAILGSSLGDSQYRNILKLGINVTLSFDNDKAGLKCRDKCIEKFKNKTEIKVIELPEGKDPGDLTGEELRSCYLTRHKI